MNHYYDKDDSTLVQLTLLGDESAFEELVTRHQRAVTGTALKITNSRFSAEDASQDAFVSAWMNLSALREREKFGIWVCSIAKNHARTLEAHYRSTIPSISLDAFENFDIPDTDADLFQYADLHEQVEALSDKIREAVKLHYFSDLSVKEIARKLSVPEGTVKWRLSEGRKQLRKGFGIMENTYNENEAMVRRVMRQVDALKLWRIKEDRSGFEAEYQAVLELVNALPESKEKSHALADTLLLGAWWVPGQNNAAVYADIKKAAEESKNQEVMQAVAGYEMDKYKGEKRIDFLLNTQIPYFAESDFWSALGYCHFWLGREYCRMGEHEKAIATFRKVMEIMPPENEYYAGAKAAICCESKVLAAKNDPDIKDVALRVAGEVYRYIDGKLYFWAQPGYGKGKGLGTANLFWNLSACNNLMPDLDMQVGERIVSDAGHGTLTLLSTTETCTTPAGTFDNCRVLEFQGSRYDLTYCKTYLCEGVGIVRQESTRMAPRQVWELASCHIAGGTGLLPFAEGNRWEYSLATPDPYLDCKLESSFEVTAAGNNSATIASMQFCAIKGYWDTFEGKMAEIRETYCDDAGENLRDVREALKEAKTLAKTGYQKAYAEVAGDAMLRILDSDKAMNPNYTEQGLWNFFQRHEVSRSDKGVTTEEREHFEWRDSGGLSKEGRKMLYSFFDEIVGTCGLGYWSEEWVPGFTAKPQNPLKSFTVLDDETVSTPAGTFQNCRHIAFDLKLKYYFGGKSECWYAEGIGFVKFTHIMDADTTAVWHLTEYKGTGKGYFPTDDGLYRKYEPESIGDGYRAALEYTFVTDENGTISLLRNATGMQARANYKKVR